MLHQFATPWKLAMALSQPSYFGLQPLPARSTHVSRYKAKFSNEVKVDECQKTPAAICFEEFRAICAVKSQSAVASVHAVDTPYVGR